MFENVAIVGGGPAGSYLGYCLAQKGIYASIFDDSHPREKPCGIHGGVMATLLDTAGWFTVAAQSKTILVTTSEFTIHFLNPALECSLHAEGWVVKAGKRIFIAEMRVSKSTGEIIAIGTETFVVL